MPSAMPRRSALSAGISAHALRLADPGRGDPVVDLATGTGIVLRGLAERARRPQVAVGVDRSGAMLAQVGPLPRGWTTITADATAVPLPDGCADVGTCCYLLHLLTPRPGVHRRRGGAGGAGPGRGRRGGRPRVAARPGPRGRRGAGPTSSASMRSRCSSPTGAPTRTRSPSWTWTPRRSRSSPPTAGTWRAPGRPGCGPCGSRRRAGAQRHVRRAGPPGPRPARGRSRAGRLIVERAADAIGMRAVAQAG